MARRIVVRLAGNLGLDDAERLLGQLTAATGLAWRQETPAEEGRHLTGVMTAAVVAALIVRDGELVLNITVQQVREIVERWRERRLDPPMVEVEVVDADEAESEAES